MLWWKKAVLSCAAMQARCCCDSQNALVEEGVLSLRCHASSLAVVITECSVQGRCYPAAMQARCCCDPQNALVEEGVCYPCAAVRCVVIHRMLWWKKGAIPALPCKLAAVVIHRMLWCEGVLSLRCHASCCCDPQNAGRRVCIPACHALLLL
jgi:hypothetical protein